MTLLAALAHRRAQQPAAGQLDGSRQRVAAPAEDEWSPRPWVSGRAFREQYEAMSAQVRRALGL